jgi:hypothetical protein
MNLIAILAACFAIGGAATAAFAVTLYVLNNSWL